MSLSRGKGSKTTSLQTLNQILARFPLVKTNIRRDASSYALTISVLGGVVVPIIDVGQTKDYVDRNAGGQVEWLHEVTQLLCISAYFKILKTL